MNIHSTNRRTHTHTNIKSIFIASHLGVAEDRLLLFPQIYHTHWARTISLHHPPNLLLAISNTRNIIDPYAFMSALHPPSNHSHICHLFFVAVDDWWCSTLYPMWHLLHSLILICAVLIVYVSLHLCVMTISLIVSHRTMSTRRICCWVVFDRCYY